MHGAAHLLHPASVRLFRQIVVEAGVLLALIERRVQKGQRELVALRFQFRHTLQAIAFQNLRLQYRDGDFSWEDALPIVETAALLGGCTYPLSRNLSTPCESEC